jgi:hypothetical protein
MCTLGASKLRKDFVLAVLVVLLLASFLSVFPIESAKAANPMYAREYWNENVVEYSFVPVMIIYKPPGTGSYQRFTAGFSETDSFEITQQLDAILYYQSDQFITTTFGVSQWWQTDSRTDPKYCGSGGDAIYGIKIENWWNVSGESTLIGHRWISGVDEATLVNSTYEGAATVARADLNNPSVLGDYKTQQVADLRGTQGAYQYPSTGIYTTGPGIPQGWGYSYTWSSSETIDYGIHLSVTVPVLGATFSYACAWKEVSQGQQTYSTDVYIYDSSQALNYTINCYNSGYFTPPQNFTIQDYIMWFNEYSHA